MLYGYFNTYICTNVSINLFTKIAMTCLNLLFPIQIFFSWCSFEYFNFNWFHFYKILFLSNHNCIRFCKSTVAVYFYNQIHFYRSFLDSKTQFVAPIRSKEFSKVYRAQNSFHKLYWPFLNWIYLEKCVCFYCIYNFYTQPKPNIIMIDFYFFSSFDRILVHLKLQTCFVLPKPKSKKLFISVK